VDWEGNTLEFLLSPTRDAQAAKRFFLKMLCCSPSSASDVCLQEEQMIQSASSREAPRIINVDKNAAYPKAIAELKASTILPARVELRHVTYVNTLIEQDHRAH
jgi:transposase, IS6 family